MFQRGNPVKKIRGVRKPPTYNNNKRGLDRETFLPFDHESPNFTEWVPVC